MDSPERLNSLQICDKNCKKLDGNPMDCPGECVLAFLIKIFAKSSASKRGGEGSKMTPKMQSRVVNCDFTDA